MPRHLRSSPQIDGPLVGVGAGLGLLWALVSIPVGLQWGVAPWSPLWERALAFTLCFPLFVGLYGGSALEWVGITWDVVPLTLMTGVAVGAAVGLALSCQLNRCPTLHSSLPCTHSTSSVLP